MIQSAEEPTTGTVITVSPRFILQTPCKTAGEVMKYNFANIHFLLERLGYETRAGALLMQCKIMLVAIKEYLTLQRRKVWADIKADLAIDGIVPIEYDLEIVENATKSVQAVHDEQVAIVKSFQEAEEAAEREVYAKLATAGAQTVKDQLPWGRNSQQMAV